MDDLEERVREHLQSASWKRTSSTTFWRAVVLTCWEGQEMWNLIIRGEDRAPGEFVTRRDSPIRSRLRVAEFASRYWGELAVKKTLEEGR